MGKGKILIIIGIILIVVGVGAYYFTNNQNNALKNQMKVAGEDYFEKYISTIETTSAYDITLKDLREANKKGENYKLDLLEKCNEDKTKTTITINMTDGKITITEVKLDC